VEAGEGELGGLDADAFDVESRAVHLVIRRIEHDAGGRFDEVAFEHLGNEGEATRGPQVALNHLDLVVLGQVLNVEGTADVKFLGNLAADFLDATGRFKVDLLDGKYQGGVTRVYTGKFDVLGNGVFHHFAVVGHSVEFDFLGVLQEA